MGSAKTAARGIKSSRRRQRFPGDPGKGKYYIGWSVSTSNLTDENGNALSYINTVTNYCQKTPDIFHDYIPDDLAGDFADKFDVAIGYGGIASLTFKLWEVTAPGSGNPDRGGNEDHLAIVAGDADSQLLTAVNACKARAPYPAWLCYYHEPEDFVQNTTQATNYRAAYRYVVDFFRDQGVTNVAWTTILSAPFVFTDREWYRIHPDWKGTGPAAASDWHTGADQMCDFFGFDTYNAGIGSTTYRFWETNVRQPIQSTMDADGFTAAYGIVPWGIFEHGMSANTNPYPVWTDDWGPDVRDWALTNCVGFCYWNSNTTGPGPAANPTAPRYDFKPVSDPTYPSKLNAWRMITGSSSNFTPPV